MPIALLRNAVGPAFRDRLIAVDSPNPNLGFELHPRFFNTGLKLVPRDGEGLELENF